MNHEMFMEIGLGDTLRARDLQTGDFNYYTVTSVYTAFDYGQKIPHKVVHIQPSDNLGAWTATLWESDVDSYKWYELVVPA